VRKSAIVVQNALNGDEAQRGGPRPAHFMRRARSTCRDGRRSERLADGDGLHRLVDYAWRRRLMEIRWADDMK
jgi:hypothetical protein